MKNKISIKTQSSRATQWHENKCVNVNLFYDGFQLGIVSSGKWGEFENENPIVEMTIDGKDYSIPLAEFKQLMVLKLNNAKSNIE